MRIGSVIALAATLGAASVADAATVASSLPYAGTADWTDIQFDGTQMTSNGVTSTLTTADYRGVWFGWGTSYGDQPSGWSPGSSSTGNYFAIDASFSPGAADWSAYFLDGSHEAAFQFNQTDCDSNVQACYSSSGAPGVTMYFANDEQGHGVSQFVALDTTQRHSFEMLLKGGQVSYRVDGQVYSGAAYQVGYFSSLLVVGDGSGPSPSGTGAMTVYSLAFDNAPDFVLTPVPEPGEWAMMGAGLLVAGFAARRRTRA